MLNRINFQYLYFLIALFIFAFVTFPEAASLAKPPIVPYIYGTPIIYCILWAIFSLILFILLKNKNIKVDIISIFLFFRIFICLVPTIYVTDTTSFATHYPVVLLTFITYLIARNGLWDNYYNYSKLLILFACILSLQVIYTFIIIDVPYFNLEFKTYINIPIAPSNVIATYLVPCLILLVSSRNSIKQIPYLILCLLMITAIIITKSRGAIIVLVLVYILYLTTIKYKFKIGYIIFIITLLCLAGTLLMKNELIQVFFQGYSEGSMSLNSLSSGRLSIFSEEINRGLQHPLFGNGMIFNHKTSLTGSHNFLIELFVQSGIIGLLTYVIPIVIVFANSIKNCRTDYNITPFILCLLAIVLHGLIEVNFFNYSTDLIFWFLSGLLMSYKR